VSIFFFHFFSVEVFFFLAPATCLLGLFFFSESVKFADETRCTYHENEFSSDLIDKKNKFAKNFNSEQKHFLKKEAKIVKQEMSLKKIQYFEPEIFSTNNFHIETNCLSQIPLFFDFIPSILGESQRQNVLVNSNIQLFYENDKKISKNNHEDIDVWYGEILHSVLNS
jgi:hypothetical protein